MIEARAAAIGAPLYRWQREWRCDPHPPRRASGSPLSRIAGEGPEGMAGRRVRARPECATRASAGGSTCRCRRCPARTRSPMPASRWPASNSSTGSRCRRRRSRPGLRRIDWPARLQRLTRGPLAETLPPGWELWLDGGHNPGAGRGPGRSGGELARPAALSGRRHAQHQGCRRFSRAARAACAGAVRADDPRRGERAAGLAHRGSGARARDRSRGNRIGRGRASRYRRPAGTIGGTGRRGC